MKVVNRLVIVLAVLGGLFAAVSLPHARLDLILYPGIIAAILIYPVAWIIRGFR